MLTMLTSGTVKVATKETVEDAIFFVAEEIAEMVFEKFIGGEISQSEFEGYSNRLRQWTAEMQRLVNLIQP